MSLNFRISQKALQDLDDIWLYTFANWSKEQADRYYNLLMDEIEFLSKEIHSGRSIGYIKTGYRSILVKSHIIFYKITEDNLLEVVRILHQMMDIDRELDY